MTAHRIEPSAATLHGHFSRELAPVRTVESGDSVSFRTLDARWYDPDQRPPRPFPGRPRTDDDGHALCGPVAIRGAEPGMALEVRIEAIRPGAWGWTSSGVPGDPRTMRMGVPADQPADLMTWSLDPESGVATSARGHRVPMRPFVGLLGMPPDEPGRHSTVPPRPTGGNIDCKELLAGSRLYLPIAVAGGLFSLGDGHAVQGDGEVAGPALECAMDEVRVTLALRPDLRLAMPRARAPAGWITFGFDEDLDRATYAALNDMLDLMQELHDLDRREAVALASLVVDLHVSQIVNGVRGVHAILPDGAIGR